MSSLSRSKPTSADIRVIQDALSLLIEPGAVFEMRILNTLRSGTVSGYFTDLTKAVRAAHNWDGKASGIYITVNPTTPSLLARANNRLREYVKTDGATGDGDIVERRWLPIDLDPVRPSGISSTDAEHEAGLTRAREIRDWLIAFGFPPDSLILADSGNGGHVFIRIQEPNNLASDGLVLKCLKALDFFLSDDDVHVDLATLNASRIMKLWGTTACKGDPIDDRPHRRSGIIDAPNEVVVANHELLERLAEQVPEEQKTKKHHSDLPDVFNLSRDLDVPAWLARNNLAVARDCPWQGHHKWVLKDCPWNPAHTNESAFVIQFADGGLFAKCHHSGCRGKGIDDLPPLFETGDDNDAPIDIEPAPTKEPAPFPVEVLPRPMAQFVNAVATSIPVPPALVALPALAAASGAIGNTRALFLKEGWVVRGVLWLLLVAQKGTGKTPALDAATAPITAHNTQLLANFNQEYAEYVTDHAEWKKGDNHEPEPTKPKQQRRVVSDTTMEALARILDEDDHGVVLIADELTGWLRGMNQYKGNSGADRSNWLSIWSCKSIIVDRKTAATPLTAPHPFVSVVGGITPLCLKELRHNDDGLIDRLLVAVYDVPPVAQSWSETGINPSVKKAYEAMFDRLLHLDCDEFNPDLEDILDSDEPTDHLAYLGQEARQAWIEEFNAHECEVGSEDFDPNLAGIWAKQKEYAGRLTLILHLCRWAAGETPDEFLVDEQSVRNAWRVIDFFKAHARLAFAALAKTPLDERIEHVVDWIRRRGGSATIRGIVHSNVGNVKTASDADTLFRQIADRGLGVIEQKSVAGGRSVILHLKKEAESWAA